MNTRRVLTILRRDLKDAIRDSRVLMIVLVPIGVGMLYNVMFDDEEPRQSATLVYAAASDTRLPDEINAVAGDTIDITTERAESAERVRAMIAEDDADVGLLIPAGFDAAVSAGEQPVLRVLQPETPSFASDYLVASVEPALRRLAGQSEPAAIQFEQLGDERNDVIIERLGIRSYYVLAAAIMQIAMTALLAVPIVLADEADKRTLDALVLIASYAEVVLAKALWGLAAIVASLALLFGVTGLRPEQPALFAGGLLLLSVALTGFGLLLGGLLRANQLNTWGGVLILPVMAPAFVVGFPAPETLLNVMRVMPTAHGMQLAVDGLSGESIFGGHLVSWLVVAGWAIAGYALLLWRLARREG